MDAKKRRKRFRRLALDPSFLPEVPFRVYREVRADEIVLDDAGIGFVRLSKPVHQNGTASKQAKNDGTDSVPGGWPPPWRS